ncbi:hypothetical protein H8E88_20830 [candidate division KSB1 bacterium]|nr:hypothetical protein [candidate division KSB1 bacterium]MBL7092625.1 hypothetical protein [candidate division KSB1 bacterium]
MNQTLDEIRKTKGVKGAFIANKNGNVAASSGELKNIPLKSMAIDIKNLLNDKSLNNKQPERFQFTYENGIIIIHVLKEIGFIVVLCEPNALNALLRLTMNVAFNKIKKDKNILKSITNA